MKSANFLLLTSVLVLAVCVAAKDKRRERQVQDFFPGCLQTLLNGTQSFSDCVVERGDARCLSDGDEAEEIQACLEDKYSNFTRPFLANMDGGNLAGRPGAAGNNPGQGPNNGPGNPNDKRNGQRPQRPMQAPTSPLESQALMAVSNCTSDFRQCAGENLRNDLTSLPNCTRTSLQNLAQCARNNTCGQECRKAGDQTKLRIPRDMLQGNRLRSCNGIRNSFLRPMCRRLSCCPDCLEAMEAVGDCFWNRVMNFLPEQCDSQCPEQQDNERSLFESTMVGSQQQPIENKLLHRTLEQVMDDDAIYNYCIELAPGLSETQRNEEELAARGGDFFDCVMDQVFVVLEVSDGGTPTENTPEAVGSIPTAETTNEAGNPSGENSFGNGPLGKTALLLISSLLILLV